MQLTATNLGHRFSGGPLLFSELNFTASAGELIAVTGPSGSGKSTLLAIAAGWIEASVGALDRSGGGRTHWVFQNPHGVPRRTARDHVSLPYLAAGENRSKADSQAGELLKKFGLERVADREFRELSGGEAQRLLLARAIASGPGLLLVDEPTAQLDFESAGVVLESLKYLAGAGAIVLVSTHDSRAKNVCARELNLHSAGKKIDEVF